MKITDERLEFCYSLALANWVQWRFCFEADTGKCPVLHNKTVWNAFINEYSLLRGVDKKERKRLRSFLLSHNLRSEITCAKDVDLFLNKMTSCKNNFRREISLLSKIMAFIDPAIFVPYDSYASHGIYRAIGIENIQIPRDYELYHNEVEKFLEDGARDSIQKFLKNRDVPCEEERMKNAFLLRVSDVFLMRCGGYWSHLDFLPEWKDCE